MIRTFLDTWSLFGHTWMVGWLVAILLSVVGVVVVARNQVFVGAAVAQSATFGVAVAMAAGSFLHTDVEWLHSDDCLVVTAMVFAMVAAALTARGHPLSRRSHEATTGWVFLVSGSLAILVLANSPQGTEEIHRLLASSMLGATTRDLWLFGVLASCSFLVLWRLRLRIVLFTMDPGSALAAGVSRRFGTALLLWLGLAVGLSIRVTGTLYTFGCLVLPALAARQFCREVRQLVWVTPLIALIGTASAFVVANHTDDPPGPMAVAFLAGLCVVGAIWHRCRRPT